MDWLLPTLIVLALLLAAWLAAISWLRKSPGGDAVTGLLWRLTQLHCRIVHRAAYRGFEEFRTRLNSGPLIVVSNHTGAVDPLLIQSACRFHVRWMMAADMMSRSLDFLWRRTRIIPVARDGRDTSAAREAIRHVQAGGAIGIFPEGRIVVPPHQIRPFQPGVGLLVARTRAPVMLIWVTGTPEMKKPTPLKSIFLPSRARVEFIELIDFQGERDAQKITQSLRERLSKASGWPLNDEPMPAT